MTHLFPDALKDAGIDTLKLIPFLFLTYLVMEWLERRTEEQSQGLIRADRTGRLGPVFGALVGIVPQCGFSAAAASLYSGGLISLGTLLAVFLSTSDEMLPLLISSQVPAGRMIRVLTAKAAIGIVTGLLADLALHALRRVRPSHEKEKHIHDLCEDAHCGCDEEGENGEGSIWRAALIHTVQIVLFVFIITLALNLVVEGFGEDAVRGILAGRPAGGVFLMAAIGLIPNCASSIMITQLWLDGLTSAGQMMAGLLVGAGVGLLVLFRTNTRHPKENVKITILLYAVGVIWGLILTGLHISF